MPETTTTETRPLSAVPIAAMLQPIDDIVGRLYNTVHPMMQIALCTEQYSVESGIVHLRSFVVPLGEFGIEIGIYAINCPCGLSMTGMLKFGRYGADFRPTQKPIIGLQVDSFPVRPENNTMLNGVLAWRKDIWPEANTMLSLVRCSGDRKFIAQDDLLTLVIMLVSCQATLADNFPA